MRNGMRLVLATAVGEFSAPPTLWARGSMDVR
jgi:hypothetical protein